MDEGSTQAVRHQRVGWLELFYDLVFVVVIERLTHLLHGDPSMRRIFTTIGLTVLVWFAWFNVTALTNVRGGIGARGRPFMFASMAGVGVLALGIEPVAEGHPWLFALGYAIARTAIWPLWWRRASGSGALRPLLWGPGVSVLWLLTPLVPEHLLAWAFAALVLLEMNLSILRPGRDHTMPSISGPHMVERLGLFLMIVLGESVVQIVNSLDTERTALTWVTGGVAMALMCALWWLIYEATMEKAELAVEKPDANPLDFIGGSQLGVVAGLVMLAAGVADAMEAAGSDRLRLTAYQKLVVLDVDDDAVEPLVEAMRGHGFEARPSSWRRATMACTGLEYCKLAIVETKQRAIDLIEELEERLTALEDQLEHPIAIHLNGCPNSCARIQVADIGLKGQIVTDDAGNQVPGYQVHLGGGLGEDLVVGRKLRAHKVVATELGDYVERVATRYVDGRADGESFGDWARRADEEQLR